MSFFTVGEDECRAWSIARGTRGAGRRRRDSQRHPARIHPRRSRRLRRADRRAARWPPAATTARSASKARNTSSRTAISSTSGSPPSQLTLRRSGASSSPTRRCRSSTGGAELHVRSLDRRSCGGAATRSSRSRCRSARSRRRSCSRRPRRGGCSISSSSNGQPIDLLIATRFPTYFARHPRKVAWVIHQHRAAYELCGTPYSDFEHTEADVGLRQRLVRARSRGCSASAAASSPTRSNTANRLQTFNGVAARRSTIRRRWPTGCSRGRTATTCCVVGRLETREARRSRRSARWRTCRAPTAARHRRRGLAARRGRARWRRSAGVRDRVVFAGALAATSSSRSTPDALAVVYAPFDEDYGYVTLEAFLCAKPVITATDSGGTLEFVVDGENGFVCAPEPAAIGARRGAARRRSRAAPRGWATPGWRGRARSPGTASWSSCLADPSTVSIVIPAMNEARRDRRRRARPARRRRRGARSSSSTTARATRPARARAQAGARVIRHPVQQGQRRGGEDRHPPRHRRVRPHRRRRRPASRPTTRAGSSSGSASTTWSSARARAQTQATVGRRGGNALLNWLASYLTGRPIPDLTSGFRGARREYLREFLHLLPNGFSTPTTTTLAFIKAGYNVAFEPIDARRAHRAVEDPLRARRREVLPDPAEDHHDLQPAAHLRPDQRWRRSPSASSTASVNVVADGTDSERRRAADPLRRDRVPRRPGLGADLVAAFDGSHGRSRRVDAAARHRSRPTTSATTCRALVDALLRDRRAAACWSSTTARRTAPATIADALAAASGGRVSRDASHGPRGPRPLVRRRHAARARRRTPRTSARWTPTSRTIPRTLPRLLAAAGDGRSRHRLALRAGRRSCSNWPRAPRGC